MSVEVHVRPRSMDLDEDVRRKKRNLRNTGMVGRSKQTFFAICRQKLSKLSPHAQEIAVCNAIFHLTTSYVVLIITIKLQVVLHLAQILIFWVPSIFGEVAQISDPVL